jgi:UDP-N-acetylmuramoyl-tripeptide--D-alanyl-D-alanine ligase
MGISHFGEMHRLSEIARPDICVLTNIGQCHLENLGSREGILKAKSEIFDFMSEDASIFVNGDDDMLVKLSDIKGKKPVRFGRGTGNDVFADEVVTKGLFGSTCNIHVKGGSFDSSLTLDTEEVFPAAVPLPGEHMVLNALASTAVGTLFHMTGEEIAAGIAAVQAVGGRSNILKAHNWTVIDDCYNANPVSMKAAIDLLSMADTRKVAILGDMFELGTTEAELHREVGEYAVSKHLDVLVCTGKLSRYMYEGAVELKSACRVLYYETRDELIAALSDIVNQNDTILVKASHGMGFDEVVKALVTV